MSSGTTRIGLIGARGHVGGELIALLAGHPRLELALVSSRERAGQPLAAHVPAYRGTLAYTAATPEALAEAALDAVVLALPNGQAAPWVAALDAAASPAVVVDLSADYRFDDAWFYGLPELTRERYQGQRRIANPGCYATAMQLAIAPMAPLLAGPATCFGVSGYSGAGTAPSDKNDPALLAGNLMPYALAGHLHEREVTRHLAPVAFMPHVAPHFRGLTVTCNLNLTQAVSAEAAAARYAAHYAAHYAGEPLVRVQADPPWVSRVAGQHHAVVGGLTLADGGRRLVAVAVLDNLLKGAATQALQNLNLAFGWPPLTGITP